MARLVASPDSENSAVGKLLNRSSVGLLDLPVRRQPDAELPRAFRRFYGVNVRPARPDSLERDLLNRAESHDLRLEARQLLPDRGART